MQSIQFRVLYRVFLMRVVDLEVLSADGDPNKLLGQFAALLSGVSLLFCVPLLLGAAHGHASDMWSMEFVFLAITMLAIGLFSVLSWDSIFPDKRDVLVLAPLPVAPQTIFFAKLSALACALGVVVLALNVFTGLLWPLCFSSTDGFISALRSYAAYWITTLAAAAFMSFSVLALQGLAPHMFPRQLFLRISALIQVVAFCLFVGLFIVEPANVTPEVLRAPAVSWLPTFWFFGLYQQLNVASGTMQPVFIALAHRACVALLIVIFGAGITLLLSYFRTMRKIVEVPEIVPGSYRIRWVASLGGTSSGAITRFCLRTLLRSRSHRVILSFYFGVGFAIILAYSVALLARQTPSDGSASRFVSTPLLAASILMMCLAIGGIRVVAAMPIALRANWVFRLTELQPPPAYLAAVRYAFIALGALPVWLGSAVLFFSLWPLRHALEHLLVLGFLGLILVEIVLRGFYKIPFTCSYLPGKGNVQFVFWICALLLLPLINFGAQIEMQCLDHPLKFCAMLSCLGIALALMRWRSAATLPRVSRMRFDEVEAHDLMSLDLGRE